MKDLIKLFLEFASTRGLAERSYIVGGTVRDLVMGRLPLDIDIAIDGNPVSIGKAFAAETGASFVLLDEAFGAVRIVMDRGHLDICPLRGGSIEADLGARDITINAMAVALPAYTGRDREELESAVIDPFGGMADIREGLIRMISAENLISDPLRLLRIYRFACILGFRIEAETFGKTGELRGLIGASAGERISEELRHILRSAHSADTINAMRSAGLLAELFPNLTGQAADRAYAAYVRAEEILARMELYFGERSGPVAEFLSGQNRTECLRLAILMSGPPSAEDAFKRLKLSRRETDFIRMLYAGRDRLLRLYMKDRTSVISFLRETGGAIYALLSYRFALDGQSAPARSMSDYLIRTYQDEYVPRLNRLPVLNGRDLIDHFSLEPSALFREIISGVELLFLEGRIQTREEAIETAGRMIRGKGLTSGL
jgi:tRNA nucleotidyltransferase/poly(A) polymerase